MESLKIFSSYVCIYQSRPWFMQPNWTPAEFYVNLWALMLWYTCKSLLNTLGSTVEQLAVCLASQQSMSKYNSHVTPVPSIKMYYKYLMRRCNSDAQMSHDIGHAHNSTHRMRLSPGSLRDPNGKGCIHVRCRMNAASSRWSYGHDLCCVTYEGIHVHRLKQLQIP